jgi:hypothetical protein
MIKHLLINLKIYKGVLKKMKHIDQIGKKFELKNGRYYNKSNGNLVTDKELEKNRRSK